MVNQPARIDQMLPAYANYDAIGTHTRHIQSLLVKRGYKSEVFREIEHPHTVKFSHHYENYERIDDNHNILIHHFSTGSNIPYYLLKCKAFTITDYHNITPPHFFSLLEEKDPYFSCHRGYRQMPLVRMSTKCSWADSQYNSAQLVEHGFKDIQVLPILRDYSYLTTLQVDNQLLNQLTQDKPNILFVGRITPNKAAHDLFFLLRAYKSFVNPKIRLILVGQHDNSYGQRRLTQLAETLGLTISMQRGENQTLDFQADIIMPGSVDEQQLATFYRASRVFVCLSDHEGFCVPLVEAMFFGLPIFAHAGTVIPETCHEIGMLLDKHHFPELVLTLQKILTNDSFEKQLKEQSIRCAKNYYTWDILVNHFDRCLEHALKAYHFSGLDRIS